MSRQTETAPCGCAFNTPLGLVRLWEEDGAVTRLELTYGARPRAAQSSVLRQAQTELEEYLGGTRTQFTVPLAPQGTPFQCEVWQALQTIPYGTTASYAQVAQQVGRPRACRAVGSANRCNPLPFFIPCHRVLTSAGTLGGYAYGTAMKRALLQLEQAE